MKFLVDENLDGMDERLRDLGHDAYSVRKLNMSGKNLGSDYSVIQYARENGLVIVTRDKEYRKASKEHGFPLILLDDEELLRIVVEKIESIS